MENNLEMEPMHFQPEDSGIRERRNDLVSFSFDLREPRDVEHSGAGIDESTDVAEPTTVVPTTVSKWPVIDSSATTATAFLLGAVFLF